MKRRSEQTVSVVLLMLASFIWGSAFVAQQVGMSYVGPFTFTFARNALAIVALVPLWCIRRRTTRAAHDTKTLIKGGVLLGLCLTLAMNLQQFGILYTTPGKAGFISATYIVLIPIFLFFRRRYIVPVIWLAVVIAFVGLFFLTMNEALTIGPGELLILACSVVYALHILIVEHLSPKVDPVALSIVQFAVCSVLSLGLAWWVETPRVDAILSAWLPLLYAGVLSSAVAYTLQIRGQRHLSAPVASLVLSLEATFSVLAGWVVLNQTLSPRETLGAVLMLIGVVLAQTPGLLKERASAKQRALMAAASEAASPTKDHDDSVTRPADPYPALNRHEDSGNPMENDLE